MSQNTGSFQNLESNIAHVLRKKTSKTSSIKNFKHVGNSETSIMISDIITISLIPNFIEMSEGEYIEYLLRLLQLRYETFVAWY